MSASSSPSPAPSLFYSGGCQCGAVRYRIQNTAKNLEGGASGSGTTTSSNSEDGRGLQDVNSGASSHDESGLFLTADFCHCRMCQKAFGNVGAALVRVRASNLHWTRGAATVFRSSSVVNRGFCAKCGTPLYMLEDDDDCYEMAVGTLDDPNAVAGVLNHQVGVESKVTWFDSIPALPARSTQEERSQDDLSVKLASLQHPDHDTAAWPARRKV